MTKAKCLKTLQLQDLKARFSSWNVLWQVRYAHPGWLRSTGYGLWLVQSLRVVNGRRATRICAVPRMLARINP